MAEERLRLPPRCRSSSMPATRSDTVRPRSFAIPRTQTQNVSSRLTLVLCPAITMDRLTIEDFMIVTPRWQKDTTGYASALATELWRTVRCLEKPPGCGIRAPGFPQRRVAVGLR